MAWFRAQALSRLMGGPMLSVPDDVWIEILAFYCELGDSQRPMLSFAEWLAASEYGRVLVPSTSLHHLCLSTVATYETRLSSPTVFITYVESSSRFEVRYYRGHGKEARVEELISPQAALPAILGWLGVPNAASQR